MATSLELDFESWLSFKLKSLNTDEGVFGSYITGILNGEETVDEKIEALEGILTEITENDISRHCQEIFERWRDSRTPGDGEASGESAPVEQVEERLVKLMETNAHTKAASKEYTEEEKRIKNAILAQYAQTSDQEFDSDDDDTKKEEKTDLVKNMNALSVAQAVKEKREKAKLECQKKKEKDKEDREKQKQLKEEKKEKRKTQKGERRR